MSDVRCAKCAEPWDYHGLLTGDVPRDQGQRILRGEGCPSCGFGTRCTSCGGTGKEPQEYTVDPCSTCYGERKVIIRKCPNDKKRGDVWISGYDASEDGRRASSIRIHEEPKILYAIETHMCRDGMVWVKAAACPDCYESAPPCPKCKGTGKFQSDELSADRALAGLESVLDASDEEPIGIINEFKFPKEVKA